MKSIAILGTRGIPAAYGGFETAAETLAIGLREAGFDVTVACEAPTEGEGSRPVSYEGVHLAYFPVDDGLRPFSEISYDIRSLLSLGSKVDIVYMFGYGAGFSFWLARLFGKILIVNCDGLEWARPKFSKLSQALLRFNEFAGLCSANLIIADSRNIAEYVRKRYGRSAHYVPYGGRSELRPIEWDPKAIETLPTQVGQKIQPDNYYLVLARLEPDNNIAEILKGFSASRSARNLLVVGPYGSRKYGRRLESIAANDQRILLAGPAYDQRLKLMLRWNCVAYLHGHMVGGTNPSLVEALESGNVILANNVPFNREVIGEDNGYPSFYFVPIADEIARLIDGVDDRVLGLREEARKKGPLRIKEAYNWEEIVHEYCAIIQGLRHERPRRRAARTPERFD